MNPRHPHACSTDAAGDESSVVRNYTLTAGRTRPRYTLSLDSVLETGPGRPGPALPEECTRIVSLCQQRRRSVTELAGTLGRPVSVVRILISDLLDARALRVPASTAAASADPTRQLLEALSAGLKARWPDAVSYAQSG
ncbi:DUF742 domain-containing protein (plasmid) [Streptomyces sp. HUAS TT11]|uniref:DUF742 domain-containing protein n=1 Tax=Streptomyces sp. HUAS TT11 TaxID=3447508 RepID=UPI003F65D5E1